MNVFSLEATTLLVDKHLVAVHSATTIMAGLTGNFSPDSTATKVEKLALSAKNFCGLIFSIDKVLEIFVFSARQCCCLGTANVVAADLLMLSPLCFRQFQPHFLSIQLYDPRLLADNCAVVRDVPHHDKGMGSNLDIIAYLKRAEQS